MPQKRNPDDELVSDLVSATKESLDACKKASDMGLHAWHEIEKCNDDVDHGGIDAKSKDAVYDAYMQAEDAYAAAKAAHDAALALSNASKKARV